MRLRNAVLDLMRGAVGASLVAVVGCSVTEPIQQDSAATLAPLVAAQPNSPPLAPVVLTATAPVVVVAPDVEPVAGEPVADGTATADESAASEPVAAEARRRHARPHPVGIAAPPDHVARPCGRG